jgi:Ser-tRNA(Ala) deacylase AlaX
MASNVQATKLLHLTQEGNFQLETIATVLSCRIASNDDDTQQGRIELQLDQTTMHPQGGGQPTDIGTISTLHTSPPITINIDRVTIDRDTNIVTHSGIVASSCVDALSLFSQQVKVHVDPHNRRLLSECHSAGHVIDAAMEQCEMLLRPTKGYHFMDGPYGEKKIQDV